MPLRYWVVVLAALLVGIALGLLIQSDGFQSSSTADGVQGSGVAATQAREVPPFGSLELAGSNMVAVRVGGKQSVIVRADDNLLSHVTTEVQDGTLVIGNTPGSFTAKSPMSVHVSVPSLESLALTGSGIVSVEGLEAPSFTVALPGSGVVRAGGTATRLEVTLAGSGDAQLAQLVARDVSATVSGSGRILVTATESLDASVPGSGAILYGGDPAHVTTSVTGSGAVARG
jgi:hypothetical protein